MLIDLHPDQAVYYKLRASYYQEIGSIERAIIDYKYALELDKNSELAIVIGTELGKLAISNNDFELAITAYTAVIEADSNRLEAYSERGIAYYALGQITEAFLDFSKAIEIDPVNVAPYVYYNRGKILYDYREQILNDQGLNLEMALADYTYVIRMWPDFAQAFTNRGLVYHELGRFDEALADHSKAIELDPSLVRAWYNRGNAYYALGDFRNAIQDYSRTLELDPGYVQAYSNRAQAFKQQGEQDSARDDLERAIDLLTQAIIANPGNVDALLARARIYAQVGRNDDAIADWRQVIILLDLSIDDPNRQEIETWIEELQ